MKSQQVIPLHERDKIYREQANGTTEYWTYSDGQRVPVSRAWAENQVCRGTATYMFVK